MTVDETGVDETVVDKLGINPAEYAIQKPGGNLTRLSPPE